MLDGMRPDQSSAGDNTSSGAASEDRYERERRFHDDVEGRQSTRASLSALYGAAPSRTAYLQAATIGAGSRALEYGCGVGSRAFDLAAAGVDVVGIDIAPGAIEAARKRARSERLAHASFEVMNAENLEVPDGSFSLVCGSGILHHLDLELAVGEIARVLEPGGRAVFVEPLGHNPLINLFRRLTPSMRTPDEHPLVRGDMAYFERAFGQVDLEFFDITGLATVPFRRFTFGRRAATVANAFDRWLVRRFPRVGWFGWTVVLRLSMPKPGR